MEQVNIPLDAQPPLTQVNVNNDSTLQCI